MLETRGNETETRGTRRPSAPGGLGRLGVRHDLSAVVRVRDLGQAWPSLGHVARGARGRSLHLPLLLSPSANDVPTHRYRWPYPLPPPFSSSSFDPVDLRSSHGATLAMAGVRMPKGDGRGRDAAEGRRAAMREAARRRRWARGSTWFGKRRARREGKDSPQVDTIAKSHQVQVSRCLHAPRKGTRRRRRRRRKRRRKRTRDGARVRGGGAREQEAT